MEYFIKFQIDYQNPGEYINKYFIHQMMQQDFYNSVCFPNERILQKHSEYMLNIGFELVNLTEILAEKERLEKEKEIEMEARRIHEERERIRKEEDLKRLKALEIEGRKREKELAEQRKISRMKRLTKLEDLEEIDPVSEVELTTSRDVKKLTLVAQANKIELESDFGINQVNLIFHEAFHESEILSGSQKGVLYLNCVQSDENLPQTYKVEEFTRDFPATPYDLDEMLEEVKNPTVFIFQMDDQIFGAYANQQWALDSKEMDHSKSNFMFQMNKDHRLRINEHQENPILQWKHNDGLGWGATDLILDADVSSNYEPL